MLITIDGPAGSGKSTAARKLAARLGVAYLDTGAMYRTVTLAALEDGVPLDDDRALTALTETLDFSLDCGPTHVRVTLREHDVTEQIRTDHVERNTRFIAKSPGVRELLVEKQRALGDALGSMVTEGRDQGSVAFPHADVKFFMDADIQTRAERRYHELLADGQTVTPDEVLAAVRERDRTDAEREVAPLCEPLGAVRIDSSGLTIAQVVDTMLAEIKRLGLPLPENHASPAARG